MRWEAAKRLALDRDQRCLICGHRDTLDVHHRRARGMGGSTRAKHELSNLMTLCRTCHDWVEAHPNEARARGYRLDVDQDPRLVPVFAVTVNGTGWWLLLDDASYRLTGRWPG